MPTTTTTRRIYAPGRTSAAVITTGPGGRGGGPTLAPPPPQTSACCSAACAGLTCLSRTRFFSGQLLTEADLNNEQSYWLAKSRLHNRYLIGWGIVCGLQISCSECSGWVNIAPGYAIDPCGNDIVVCSPQSFNVLKAIQACCAPTPQTANCAPLRYTPPPECKQPQEFCIAIQYQEQPSRLVTPLVQASTSSTTCSCGGTSKGGCGCGCGGAKSNGSSTSTCGCASSQPPATVPAGACEPTRINEGFQLCLVPAPQQTIDRVVAPQPGTYAYQIANCIQGLSTLTKMQPTIDPNNLPATYNALCSYLNQVNHYFLQNQFVTHCTLLEQLNRTAKSLVLPGNPGDIASYQNALATLQQIFAYALNDCKCAALLTPCPPDPCDNRLILACVTVDNGVITGICPFEGRRQLIGYTALNYWLGSIFSHLASLIGLRFEAECCAPIDFAVPGSTFSSQVAYDKTNLTTDSFNNPALLNRIITSFFSQQVGASLVNVVAPQARAVDLRPMIGQTSQFVLQSLTAQGFTTNVTTKNVDGDPSWDAAAVSVAAQAVPAAVSVGQPLTVYTKGVDNTVVGIEVTDPTTILQNQVAALTKQISNLGAQAAAAKPAPAPTQPPTPAASPTPSPAPDQAPSEPPTQPPAPPKKKR